MAIQIRRGAATDFDSTKMVSGELAVSTDGSHKVWATGAAGDCWELQSAEDAITDVKVNGTSVVEDGEADIPLATDTAAGVVKIDDDYGLRMGDDGTLKTYAASDSVIKTGTNSYRPVAPNHVHEAAFYGLAKAAGDSTQASSSNPVGTYTDGAKTAIQGMLGVTEELTHLKQDINELEEGKADASGTSENLTAGNAEQLITDKGIVEKVPYLLRASGGNGADREEDKIVGGTVAWNQLVRNGNFDTETDWSFQNVSSHSVTSNVETFTVNSDIGNINTPVTFYAHKYFISVDIKLTTATTSVRVQARFAQLLDVGYTSSTTNWQTVANIMNGSAYTGYVRVQDIRTSGWDAVSVRNVKVFDLTQMFGTAIADRAYAMEQSTAGSGINWLKSMGFFTADYYPYDAGTLKSVEGLTAHIMRDSEDNIIASYLLDSTLTLRGIPKLDSNNQLYYDGDTYESDGTVKRRFIDKVLDGVTNGLKATESLDYTNNMRFLIPWSSVMPQANYKGNTTLCLSSKILKPSYDDTIGISNATPATYAVYPHSLGLFFTLPKAQYDTVEKANEFLANNLIGVVYELKESTTEEAEPYQNPQIVDPYGTEEYVTTGIVPVGHETFYPENLRAKIEGLPFNFATLIAPTETSYKATRAYSANNLFIVNNILYKATTSIASGGTITPGTNCTATTLAEIIAALS